MTCTVSIYIIYLLELQKLAPSNSVYLAPASPWEQNSHNILFKYDQIIICRWSTMVDLLNLELVYILDSHNQFWKYYLM